MKLCIGGCVVILYLTSLILFACSFSTLSPLEAGLRRSSAFATLDKSQVYTPGRYFVDVLHGFIRYPLTLQTIRFANQKEANKPPLKSSVAGGQEVKLSCSFQYRLMLHKLIDLYLVYEQNWETQYISLAEETIKNVIKQYPSEAVYQNRIAIGQVVHAALNEKLQERFAVVEHFQILTVEPPAKTAAKILQKIITQEQINTQTIRKESLVLATNITVIEQEASQKSRRYQSEAEKQANKIRSEAEATAIGIRLNATATAYENLKTELGLSNDELIQFLFFDHIRTLGGASNMAIGLDTAFVSLN